MRSALPVVLASLCGAAAAHAQPFHVVGIYTDRSSSPNVVCQSMRATYREVGTRAEADAERRAFEALHPNSDARVTVLDAATSHAVFEWTAYHRAYNCESRVVRRFSGVTVGAAEDQMEALRLSTVARNPDAFRSGPARVYAVADPRAREQVRTCGDVRIRYVVRQSGPNSTAVNVLGLSTRADGPMTIRLTPVRSGAGPAAPQVFSVGPGTAFNRSLGSATGVAIRVEVPAPGGGSGPPASQTECQIAN